MLGVGEMVSLLGGGLFGGNPLGGKATIQRARFVDIPASERLLERLACFVVPVVVVEYSHHFELTARL